MFDDNGNGGNKPILVIKDPHMPSISCSVFEREGQYGKWYSITAPQIWRKKEGSDEGQYYGSFSPREIPAAVRVLSEALNKTGELATRDRQLRRETTSAIKAGNEYGKIGTYDFDDEEIV